MGPATGNGKREVAGPKPTAGLQIGQPGVDEITVLHKSAVTKYTNLHFNATEKENAVLRQDKWAKAAQKAKMAKRSERLSRFEERA